MPYRLDGLFRNYVRCSVCSVTHNYSETEMMNDDDMDRVRGSSIVELIIQPSQSVSHAFTRWVWCCCRTIVFSCTGGMRYTSLESPVHKYSKRLLYSEYLPVR